MSQKRRFWHEKGSIFPFFIEKRKIYRQKRGIMRNSKTHSVTIKKQLAKCKSVFHAYNDIQYAYGIRLDSHNDIADIECNIKLVGCPDGDHYTTDFYCTKTNGEIMVRECVEKSKLLKPMTAKLLDISRNYWLSKGVLDWGIVLGEGK